MFTEDLSSFDSMYSTIKSCVSRFISSLISLISPPRTSMVAEDCHQKIIKIRKKNVLKFKTKIKKNDIKKSKTI